MWWSKLKGVALAGLLLGASACAEDPFDFGGPRSCSIADQNTWVYDLMLEAYLWREELPEVDPTAFDSPTDLIRTVRYDVDRWSRASDKVRSDALFQEGQFVGLGFGTRRDEQDRVVVSTVHEQSPAGRAGMRRGDVIAAISGFTIEQIDDEDRWGEVYGENEPGVTVSLDVETASGEMQTHMLTKEWIDMITVPYVDVLTVEGEPVGYLVFSTFVEPSYYELTTAFATFREAGVRDVVLDLRYNTGGLVSVARHLMNLLVGAEADGEIAYYIRYGSGLAENDTSRKLSKLDESLPELDSVTFITTSSTVSASELVINGVRPYADIRLVGTTTGGKPVGSKQWDFCDKVLSPITFQLLNADEEGDYFEGLDPTCWARDDLAHQLGDPAEGSLAEALTALTTGTCSEQGEAPPQAEPAPHRRVLPPQPDRLELLQGTL